MADIFDIENMRDRKRMVMENEVAIISPHSLILNFWQSAFQASFTASLKAFELAASTFLPPSDPEVTFAPNTLERFSGLSNLQNNLQTPGKTTFARYAITNPADKLYKDDTGHRIFALDVSSNLCVANFFHGDLEQKNGKKLELVLGTDGQYRPFALYHLKDDWQKDQLPTTQESVAEFLGTIAPARELSAAQRSVFSSHLRLVR